MNSAKPLIEIEDVTVCYGRDRVPALSHVSLTIGRGDFLAVSGPNGGGKTTLMRVILKLLRPTSGKVTYLGPDGLPAKGLRIGYLPQKSAIDTRFPITVREVILSGLPGKPWGRPGAEALRRLERVADLTGASRLAGRGIGELSGGQLQRVLLARAIISDPEILVLDEPLSYVDKRFEQQIYGLVGELARHTTIVLVSHEMSVISGMADRHVIVDRTLTHCHALHHYMPAPRCETGAPPDID